MKWKNLKEVIKFAALIGVFVVALNWQSLAETLRGPVAYDAKSAGAVTLYSTSWCGYCARTRRFLRANDVPFRERDIEASSDAFRVFTRLGGRGVPVVTVGERVVHGYDLGRLRGALECAQCGAK